jgi:protein kinase A
LVTPPSSFSSSGASRAAGDSEQQQQQQQQRPPSSPTAAAVAASGGNHYNHHHQQQHPSQGGFQGGFQGSFQGSLQGSTAAGAVHSQRPMNAQPPHPYPASSSMSTSASASATTSPHSHATSKAGSHDSQNLPSISSLINPPQHDGAGNAYINSSSSYPATLSAHITPPASASPGTDPSRLQHQQHQAHPPPPMQSTMQQHTPHQGDQQQQLHQQAQQLQQQEQHMQQQPQPSQPRVTKGKYSLVDFEIQRTLGTGSFGRVHLVQSKHNQRFYAVKVLKKAQVVKMKQVEHTNDERRMLSDVKHPFLITLWGTFQDWKNLYMVMDFVEGGELFSLLRKSGRFPNPVAKFYAAEVTLALEYLHSKNIIYRDLKPENLLLDRHGHLKITDFGFAKRVPDKTWTLCGTPDYLAPEVVSNKGYNKSVDWWSLGILIYEMLCGYTPFWDSGSPMKIYENILKGKVKYPGYINPDAQDLLQRLITADLTKRLGNLFGGSQDVKNHPWFSEVTWDRLARKDIDAPYTPPVKAGAGDASQFDRYPEDPEKYGIAGGNDEFGHLFTEF